MMHYAKDPWTNEGHTPDSQFLTEAEKVVPPKNDAVIVPEITEADGEANE